MTELYLPGNRPYQTEAIYAPFKRWGEGAGNGLIVMPTGTGKSRVIAGISFFAIKAYYELNPRILKLTHVEDLIAQNSDEVLDLWPEADLGIYSAALKRKDTHNRIVMGSVQSLVRNPTACGRRDILMIDECHLLSHKESGMYRKVIKALQGLNPNLRIVGLTATPFRLDSGRLTDPWRGVEPIFSEIFYEYDIIEAFNEGYLTRLTTKSPKDLRLDTTGVKVEGKEFKQGELQKAVNKDTINHRIVADALERGEGRKTWLWFTTGVEHMNAIADVLREHNESVCVLYGDMDKPERRGNIANMRAGNIRHMVSVRVATTGLNIPNLDCIVDVGPTMSLSLHIQKYGRGTRNVYAPGAPLDTAEQRLAAIAEGPKPDCLALDYAGNIHKHGPIDHADGTKSEGGAGSPPMKDCPECDETIHASKMKCPKCGYDFPKPEPKYSDRPIDAPFTSDQMSNVWHNVTHVTYSVHRKEGSNPSLRITHLCGLSTEINLFLPFDSPTPGGQFMARKRWIERFPGSLVPETTHNPDGSVAKWAAEVALELSASLRQPGRIFARRNGKYWDYISSDFSVPPGMAVPKTG